MRHFIKANEPSAKSNLGEIQIRRVIQIEDNSRTGKNQFSS